MRHLLVPSINLFRHIGQLLQSSLDSLRAVLTLLEALKDLVCGIANLTLLYLKLRQLSVSAIIVQPLLDVVTNGDNFFSLLLGGYTAQLVLAIFISHTVTNLINISLQVVQSGFLCFTSLVSLRQSREFLLGRHKKGLGHNGRSGGREVLLHNQSPLHLRLSLFLLLILFLLVLLLLILGVFLLRLLVFLLSLLAVFTVCLSLLFGVSLFFNLLRVTRVVVFRLSFLLFFFLVLFLLRSSLVLSGLVLSSAGRTVSRTFILSRNRASLFHSQG
mmetsp:Transcript_25466/g.42936  ORF Transcript_25466/g.42936 Transcript_25466/m.42936 type:complete len:273 (-) Transcript_25466:1819-2637(-)